MDRIETYRQIVMTLLEEYNQYRSDDEQIEQDVVFDRDRDHYQVLVSGWQGTRRLFYPIIHIDIKDGKVWLQYDGTDAEIAKSLVERGIPQDQIVLGFHPERLRQHTDFAIN